MHFTIQREALLKPLQLVAGVVERRQTLPVLSNVLLVVDGQQLSLTGTVWKSSWSVACNSKSRPKQVPSPCLRAS